MKGPTLNIKRKLSLRLSTNHEIFISAVLISASVGAFAIISAGDNDGAMVIPPTNFALLLVLLALAVAGSLVNMLQTPPANSDGSELENALLSCFFAALLAGMEIVNAFSPINPEQALFAVALINIGFTFNIVAIGTRTVHIGGKWPMIVGGFYAAGIVALTVVQLATLNDTTIEEFGMIIGIFREIELSLLPLTLITLTLTVPSLRVNLQKLSALRQRFWFHPANSQDLIVLYSISLLAFLLVGATVLNNVDFQTWTWTSETHGIPIARLSLAWIPLLWRGFKRLERQNQLTHESKSLLGLTDFHAKRFFLRNISEAKSWASTMSMRGATFFIDHDSHDDASKIFPSSLIQIRREEISRSIRQILGPTLLSHRVVGNQVFGMIDPELARRPSVDVLTLFASVYLDAAPLVERRLKVLTSLLPILDPALAERLKPELVAKSLSGIEWMFHFDYDWIDQQIQNTSTGVEYAVNTTNIMAVKRHKIIRYFSQRNSIGNFILVGESARERLLMEAPYLVNAIEAWPISIEGDEDIVVFLIRFEELIPRLQKYYGLDDARMHFKDYEPSKEARRMASMIEFQISQAKNVSVISDSVLTITNYPWYGFKEKDAALRLILKGFERFQVLRLGAAETKETKAIEANFIRSLERVGYPSQIIHHAHLSKISLRDTPRLLEVLQNDQDDRFGEAWLYLSSFESSRYTTADLAQFVKLIIAVTSNKSLKRKSIVRSKICEAFFNVAYSIPESEIELLTKATNCVGRYLATINADPALCCLFLDGKIFLEEQIKCNILLDHDVVKILGQHFSTLYRRFGSDSPHVIALSARWKVLISQIRLAA